MKQRRGIRRIIIRASIFLLLGAIVNIAVAWSVQSAFGSRYASHELACRYRDWEIWYFKGFGFTEVGLVLGGTEQYVRSLPERLPPSWSRLRHVEPYQRTDPVLLLTDLAYGWPMRSLWYEFDAERSWVRPGILSQRVAGCLSIGNLALRPLWPGFAINTLFYAAILWLLFAAPFALRRWRRIKHGLCPACAYPVGASDLCTECGMPIPLSLRERVRVRAKTS